VVCYFQYAHVGGIFSTADGKLVHSGTVKMYAWKVLFALKTFQQTSIASTMDLKQNIDRDYDFIDIKVCNRLFSLTVFFYLGKLLVILFKFLQRVTYSISLILLTLLFLWKLLSSSHVFYIIFLWFHIFIFLKILTLHNFVCTFLFDTILIRLLFFYYVFLNLLRM
jgi:hypothetical protein